MQTEHFGKFLIFRPQDLADYITCAQTIYLGLGFIGLPYPDTQLAEPHTHSSEGCSGMETH
jgi:hypothetical protein